MSGGRPCAPKTRREPLVYFTPGLPGHIPPLLLLLLLLLSGAVPRQLSRDE